jgi:hypothetical protein
MVPFGNIGRQVQPWRHAAVFHLLAFQDVAASLGKLDIR